MFKKTLNILHHTEAGMKQNMYAVHPVFLYAPTIVVIVVIRGNIGGPDLVATVAVSLLLSTELCYLRQPVEFNLLLLLLNIVQGGV